MIFVTLSPGADEFPPVLRADPGDRPDRRVPGVLHDRGPAGRPGIDADKGTERVTLKSWLRPDYGRSATTLDGFGSLFGSTPPEQP